MTIQPEDYQLLHTPQDILRIYLGADDCGEPAAHILDRTAQKPYAIVHNQIAVMNRMRQLHTLNRLILGIVLREIQFRLLAVSCINRCLISRLILDSIWLLAIITHIFQNGICAIFQQFTFTINVVNVL